MKNNIYFLIKEYVFDHYENFGFYPVDVKIGNKIYKYNEYWKILEKK